MLDPKPTTPGPGPRLVLGYNHTPAWIMPGTKPRIVRITLIQKCLPIPTCKNTPKVGEYRDYDAQQIHPNLFCIRFGLSFVPLPPSDGCR
jgi:hypothetical protein